MFPEGFVESAQKVFTAGYEEKIEIAISALSFINTLYIGRHYGFRTADLIKSLKAVKEFCEVTSIDFSVIDKMLDSSWNDKEDAAQYFSALNVKSDCIVTRNIKDYEKSSVPVYSLEDFVDKYCC